MKKPTPSHHTKKKLVSKKPTKVSSASVAIRSKVTQAPRHQQFLCHKAPARQLSLTRPREDDPRRVSAAHTDGTAAPD